MEPKRAGFFSRLFKRKAASPSAKAGFVEERAAVAAISLRSFPISAVGAGLPPAAVVEGLNRYLNVVLNIVRSSSGRCLQHVGDAVIAEWQLDQNEATQRRAVGTAICEIVRAVRSLQVGEQSLQVQIGLGYGTVIHSSHLVRDKSLSIELGPAINDANRLAAICGRFESEVLFFATLPVDWPADVKIEELDQIIVAGREGSQLLCAARIP